MDILQNDACNHATSTGNLPAQNCKTLCLSLQAVYTTACCGNETVTQGSFAPFSVNYTERYSAAGRTRYARLQFELS